MCLAFDWVEEIKEGILGHFLGDGPHCASAFVLLLFLNDFHCYIFAFVPVNLAAREQNKTFYPSCSFTLSFSNHMYIMTFNASSLTSLLISASF